MSACIAHLRGLGPSAAAQAAALPDMADGLAGQLVTLSRDPEPWRCEQMALNLEGARLAVLRLRESLLAETPHDAT